MSSHDIPIIKLAFHNEWKVLSHALKTDPNLEMEDFHEAGEVATYLGSVKAALIIASIGNKQDFIQLATLLKIHKKVAPDTIIKLVVVNFSGDKTYEKGTAKLGIQDILEPNMATKALRFKVDFWIKGLKAQAKKVESALAYKNASSTDSKSKSKTEETSIIWKEAIDCEDDVWLIKQPDDCKKVLGKWLVRLTGPSPYVAQWTEVNGRNNLWKFEFKKEERDAFVSGDGNWYFRGEQKPDFVWKENVWMISGSQFDLYYQDSKDLTSWMSMQNRVLTICKNSEYAKTKENLILQSFDKEMVFKKDGSIDTNAELEQDGADRFKNLEGKGKTEKQNKGPLSGKSSTDDLSSGLLAMDLDPDENKNNEHEKHWEGHNESEEFKENDPTAPASDKLKEGTELEQKNKNNEHKKHWKGHNEAEELEGASEKERKTNAATRRKDLSGKVEEAKDPNDSDYGGKSSTDKLNKYYDSKEKADSKDKKQKQRDQETSDDSDEPMSEVSELNKVREQKRAKREVLEKQEAERIQREEKALKEKQGAKGASESSSKGKKAREEFYNEFEDSNEGQDQPLKKERAAKTKTEIAELEEEEELLIEDELAAREFKKRSNTEKAGQKRQDEDLDEENNSQKGSFKDEIDESLGGKSKTDQLKSHYKNRDATEGEIEEEKKEASSIDDDHRSRKNLNRKDNEKRVKGLDNKLTAEDLGLDEDLLSESLAKLKKSKRANEEENRVADVPSLAEARKVRELQRVLEEENDPTLEEAVESAEIFSLILQNENKYPCKFDDFFDQAIIFSIGDSEIDHSLEVELDLRFKYLSKETKLKLKGQISQEVQADDFTKYVTVQISEDAIRAFESFMKLYQIRQKNIDFFIKKVKGL